MKQQSLGQYWSPDYGDVSPDMVLVCQADLKLRRIPAASTNRPTCALRTIVIFFS